MMGVMKELRDKHSASSESKKKQSAKNGFNFISFYPTKEQKQEIRALQVEVEELSDLLTAVLECGYCVKLKAETSKSSLSLTILQDVPFGTKCNALSMWHVDITTLFKQFLWLGRNSLEKWIETGALDGVGGDPEW